MVASSKHWTSDFCITREGGREGEREGVSEGGRERVREGEGGSERGE